MEKLTIYHELCKVKFPRNKSTFVSDEIKDKMVKTHNQVEIKNPKKGGGDKIVPVITVFNLG